MSWEETVQTKREAREEALNATLHSLPPDFADPFDFKGIDGLTLVSKLAAGEITAERVTIRAIHNAIHAQRDTNCISEPLFDSALNRARELDQYLQTTGKTIGPLHGLPISVKDQFNVQGIDTTLGYVGRSFKPAKQDAVLVVMLRKLGAIIITKTAIPQSILWNETESPLWGVTTYPGKRHLTPGGSSGGEAALLTMSGCLVSWATDIGGSIRQPAALCGLYGMKPSSSRLPYSGVPVSHEGQSHVPSSIGPLTRDLPTLITVMKESMLAEPWILDPNVTPLPWREDIFQSIQKRPLRVGMIFDDGVVKPHPEIEAAVRLAADMLEAAGHEIVNWDTTDHIECIKIMDQFYRADGGEDIRREVEAAGEPMIPHVAALVGSSKPISVYEYWQLSRHKTQAQESYNSKWNETAAQTGRTKSPSQQQELPSRSVDVIISPVTPHTAVPHRSARWTGYTKIWNFVDYTALAIPFGTLSQDPCPEGRLPAIHAGAARQEYMENYVPRNALDRWNQGLYNPQLMDGLPIGLQIIGRRFEEEKVLGVANVLGKLVAYHCKT